jgi:hypothetical protein
MGRKTMAAKKAANAEQLQTVFIVGTILTIDYYNKNKIKGFIRKVMRKFWLLDTVASIFGLDSSSLHSHLVAVGRGQLATCGFDLQKWEKQYGSYISAESLKALASMKVK